MKMNRSMGMIPRCSTVWVAPGKVRSTIWSDLLPEPPLRQDRLSFREDSVLTRAHIFHHVEYIFIKLIERALQLFHLLTIDHRFNDVDGIGRSFTMRQRGSEIEFIEYFHQVSSILLGIDATEHDPIGDALLEQYPYVIT